MTQVTALIKPRLIITLIISLFILIVSLGAIKNLNAQEDPAPTNGAIVDDGDAGFEQFDSDDGQFPWWGNYNDVGGNGDLTYTGNSINSDPHNWATWTATGLSGELEVFASIPNATYIYTNDDAYYGTILPLTTQATYVITHAGGESTVQINQLESAGTIVSLGTYTFDGTGQVYLSDVVPETGELLIAGIVFDTISFGVDISNYDLTPPLIENVKAMTTAEGFFIEAKVTDVGSGVASVILKLTRGNGAVEEYVMTLDPNNSDIYSVKVPGIGRGESIDYEIIAVDNAGNTGSWSRTLGYIARGSFGRGLGYPRWSQSKGRNLRNNAAACYSCGGDTQSTGGLTSDPVNSQNGNLVDQNKLLIIPGRPEIDLHLTYNSQGGSLSIFGESWTHSYNYHLLELANADFTGAFVQYPDGQIITFHGSSFEAEPGIYDTLTKTGDGFELKLKNLTKIFFDSEGDITRWEDANGNGITFSYGTKYPYTTLSQITSLKADGGREVTFEYTDYLVTKVRSAGVEISLEYNEALDLTKIVHPNGNATGFEYVDHNMTRKISPKGHAFFTNTYDSERKVLTQHAGENFVSTFQYNGSTVLTTDSNGGAVERTYDNELLKSIKDEKGNTLFYEYDDERNVVTYIDRDGNHYGYQYDENGNVIEETDPLGYKIARTFDLNVNKPVIEIEKLEDHKTEYEYDSKGNLLKITNAEGYSAYFEYNGFGQLINDTDFNGNVTTYTYSSFGDLETVTHAEGNSEIFEYDGLGRVTKYTNGRGISYNYIYDANGNLLRFEGPLGYKLQYEYDLNNNLVKEIDANGGSTNYSYNASDKLISQVNQLGFETTMSYGAMNELVSIVDPEQRITNLKYDPTYNLIEERNAVGTAEEILTQYSYNGMKNNTSVIDPEGRATAYEIDPLQRVIASIENANGNDPDSENNVTTIFEYSPTSAITSVTDPNGNKTEFILDKMDRVVQSKDAENQITHFEYDGNGNLVKETNPRGYETKFIYDRNDRLVTIIDARNGETKFTYDGNDNIVSETDANGVLTKFTYNELDRLGEKLQNFKDGEPASEETNVSTKYGYDLHGNLISQINPRGYETKFGYDAAHRLINIVDAKGGVSNYEYDRVDNLVKYIDRNSNAYTYQYDNLNRLVVETNPEGHTDIYAYDKVGNIVNYFNKRGMEFNYQYDPLNRVKVTTDPLENSAYSVYDPVGNLMEFTDENGHTDKYSYDKVYRLIKYTDAEENETEYRYDANSNLVKLIDGNDNETNYTFDELDRLIEEINAESESTKYAYDALVNIVRETEADNTQHLFDYDPLYRLTSVVNNYKDSEPSNNDTNVTTRYNYDANGNLRRQINPLGNVTAFDFDELDRLVTETNPLNNSWNYGYDPEGNLTSRLDANGKTTMYEYYPDNVLETIMYVDTNESVTYTYSETNFPKSMVDNLGTTNWDYDELDRMIEQDDPFQRLLGYEYDKVGNLTTLEYPDGRTISHEYLKNDWLRLTETSDEDAVEFLRDGVGNTVGIDRSNSSQSRIQYDRVYRPLQVQDTQVGSGNHLITKFNYEYNEVGDITSQIAEYGWRQPSRVVDTYQYDGLHRLARAESNDNQKSKYSYDAAGNRTKMEEWIPSKNKYEVRSYEYNQANQLMSYTQASPLNPRVVAYKYSYDNNGNRTSSLIQDGSGVDRGFTYNFDMENRLTRAQEYNVQKGKTNQLGNTVLEYDGNGRRLVKTFYPGASQPGQRNEYTFDRLDPVATYEMQNGQRTNMYRDSSQNLQFFQDFKSEQDPSGTLMFYHYDGEGNIAATSKARAQSDKAYRYDEYGLLLPETGNDKNRNNGASGIGAHNDYSLTGKEFDANMNLFYFGARHYDALTGTWISQDSYRGEIQNPMSLHRYMYNYDSPINYQDWYGYYAKQIATYRLEGSKKDEGFAYDNDITTNVFYVNGDGNTSANYTNPPILFVNGIQTNEQDGIDAAEELSRIMQAPVYFVHNPTNGAADLNESLGQKMDWDKANSTDFAIRKTMENHPEIRTMMGHSQGALYVANYTQYNPGRVDTVVTFGGAATTIENVPNVTHYKAGLDIVAYGFGARDGNIVRIRKRSGILDFTLGHGLMENYLPHLSQEQLMKLLENANIDWNCVKEEISKSNQVTINGKPVQIDLDPAQESTSAKIRR